MYNMKKKKMLRMLLSIWLLLNQNLTINLRKERILKKMRITLYREIMVRMRI